MNEYAQKDAANERKTLVGFIASVALLVLVFAVVILAVRGFRNTNRWLAHSHEVIGELEGLAAALAETEAARRAYLSSGDSTYLKERESALIGLDQHLQAAKQSTRDNAVQQSRLRDLESSAYTTREAG